MGSSVGGNVGGNVGGSNGGNVGDLAPEAEVGLVGGDSVETSSSSPLPSTSMSTPPEGEGGEEEEKAPPLSPVVGDPDEDKDEPRSREEG